MSNPRWTQSCPWLVRNLQNGYRMHFFAYVGMLLLCYPSTIWQYHRGYGGIIANIIRSLVSRCLTSILKSVDLHFPVPIQIGGYLILLIVLFVWWILMDVDCLKVLFRWILIIWTFFGCICHLKKCVNPEQSIAGEVPLGFQGGVPVGRAFACYNKWWYQLFIY